MNRTKSSYIDGSIEKLESIVKHGKPRLKRKKLKDRVLGKKTKLKRNFILKKARKKAHTSRADMLKKMSEEIRNNFG
jgi:hypothetical protein